MGFKPLLFIVALCIVVIQVHSQQCLSFDPSAAPASKEVCPPYLSPLVWLPLIPNAISLVDNVFNSSVLWQVVAVRSILSIECYDALASLLCNAAFPPCNYTNYPQGDLPLAYPACRSACEHVNSVCSYFFSLFDQAPVNCSQTDVITGEAQWPIEYRDNFFFTFSVNSTCFTTLPTDTNTSDLEAGHCPYPLVPVDHFDPSLPPCYIPCPDPTWTPKEWHDIAIIEFSFSLLSFVLMVLIIIHYVADPKCRNTSRRFQLYSYISQMFFAFAFVMSGPFPQKSTWCANSTTFATVHKPTCGTQAFFFVVFGLAAAIWWAITSSIMYTQLDSRKYRISKRKELFYWVIAFGFPLVPFFVAVGQNVITFYWLTPFCFIQFLIGDTRLDYHYVLFYIPLCVPVMVAMGFISATIYKLVMHSREMKTTFKGQEQSGGASLIKINIRLFAWCASLLLFFLTIIIYRSILEREYDSLQDDAYAWGVCKVRYELGVGTDELCPESKFPHPLNYPGTVVHYIICTSLGTLSFLSFGTTTNIYYFWYYVAQLTRKREWGELRELLTNEKAFAAMRLRDIRNSTTSSTSTQDHVKLDSFSENSAQKNNSRVSSSPTISMELIEPEQNSSYKSDVNEESDA